MTTADLTTLDQAGLEAALQKAGDTVKALKAKKVSKEEVQPAVDHLLAVKAEVKRRAEQAQKDGTAPKEFDRAALDALLAQRFFVAPSFQIYGGIAGLYDYGPPACALQNNILAAWRHHFVLEEDMLEVECTNLTPESVLKTSGHVDRFADYMVKDVKTGDIFRADHLVKQVLKQRLDDDQKLKSGLKVKVAKGKPQPVQLDKEVRDEYDMILETLDNYVGEDLTNLLKRLEIRAPETGNELSEPVLFNLMFETQIGPTGQFRGFLRPETAQGHFLNFKKLLEFNNDKMPFASASVGKSFRNEISPRQGLLRVREFTMAEIEHYVDPTKKDHPRFGEVRNVVVPLYSASAQAEAAGPTKLSIGEAVDKGIINNQTLGYFVARIYLFLLRIGIDPARLRMRQHMANEMAHYATDCWDAEIQSSYGWIECVGCADRSAYDLTAHSKRTGERLTVQERLAEPIVTNALELDILQPNFGKTLKKNAKVVETYLNGFKNEDEEWNEKELTKLDEEIKAKGSVTVTAADGNQYELNSTLISITRKTKKVSVRNYVPNVIEPSFGIGRILYQLLEHSYYVRQDDEQRAVFKFRPGIAPNKALVVPISQSDRETFEPHIKQVVSALRRAGVANKVDNSGASIGRRYARNDELGTPFAVTVDFQTLKDGTVTLRERDSTKQIRESISTVVGLLKELVEESTTWEAVAKMYPEFVAQEV
ncbi:Glycine--tRNA ligase 1, mitochondrial [Rhizophlyctis rosea]|uniref:glycine--tRNA ligase n=1 Tax=Rhizophlyctis rosea TaxID=64517 RepID=A0AAD5S5V1_9FUNG|nr:Glycine--tRNA ligase 1, mitochondrial [Rhizophlyctis rosea]